MAYNAISGMYFGCVSNVYLGYIRGCIQSVSWKHSWSIYGCIWVYRDVSRVQLGVYTGEGSTGWPMASTPLQEIEGPGCVGYTPRYTISTRPDTPPDKPYIRLPIHPRYIKDTPQIYLRIIWVRVQMRRPAESKLWALVYPG